MSLEVDFSNKIFLLFSFSALFRLSIYLFAHTTESSPLAFFITSFSLPNFSTILDVRLPVLVVNDSII